MGEALAWSEGGAPEADRALPAALGVLEANKPGESQARDGAVVLQQHSVKVRISGAVARTEIEEVFLNETDDVLEGLYRFPLPADATVDRLALDVGGRLEEAAFVDRERAAAIWRGAIVNFTQVRPKTQDPIVWVPGPWHDPALLEWQRGNRFELHVFPIPKRGTRRVVLGYTQLVQPAGMARRYLYPLAYDPKGSTRVGQFSLDVEVRGHDAQYGVHPEGYALSPLPSASEVRRLAFEERNFQPTGDLVLDYALPDRNAELTTWVWQADPNAVASTVSSAPATVPRQPPSPHPLAVQGAPKMPLVLATAPSSQGQRVDATGDELAPYAVFALRPHFPRPSTPEPRDLALVVDVSRSMLGENEARASTLLGRLLEGLEPSDRFTVLACDSICRNLPGGLRAPSEETTRQVLSWLGQERAEGGSDVSAAVGTAARLLVRSAAEGRLRRVVYLGDATPTVGPIRPSTVELAVRTDLAALGGNVALVAVGVGGDADPETLQAMARGGGGVAVSYLPGRPLGVVAQDVLSATRGALLSEVSVELPGGLAQTAPSRIPTLAAGQETMIVARMTRTALEGTLVLRGKVAGAPFEQRYPVSLAATTSDANAFVPRLYAAARIAELERQGTDQARREAVSLSQHFGVASHYTSLLVLESEAMFRAFGLGRAKGTPLWTGETNAESRQSIGEVSYEDDGSGSSSFDDEAPSPGASMGAARAASGSSRSAPAPSAARRPAKASSGGSAAAPSSAPWDPSAGELPLRPVPLEEPVTPWRPQWIAMRRIWEYRAEILTSQLVPSQASVGKILEAERRWEREPERRALLTALEKLYALIGDLKRASELAERWSSREPLDPDALTARSDLAARMGRRDDALRILGSVVDVRPSDVKAQQRLARAYRWAGQPELGCRYSLAIAEYRPKDAALLADALRCLVTTGRHELRELLLHMADETTGKRAEGILTKDAPEERKGALRLEAQWDGSAGQDLDLSLLHPQGHRVSWLGAPTRSVIVASDVIARDRESLSLRGAEPGDYIVEVLRTAAGPPVSGKLSIQVGSTHRELPFEVNGTRSVIALVRVSQQARLVPY